LDKVHPNIKLGRGEFALFEIGKAHNRQHRSDGKERVPAEFQMLAAVVVSKDKKTGAPFYQARAVLDYLAARLGIGLEYRPITKEEQYQVAKPFDHKRSAQVWDLKNNTPLGMVGEYKTNVCSNFKLPAFSAGFEIGVEQLQKSAELGQAYRPLNRYPSLGQDLCLRSPATLTYAQLTDFLYQQLEKAAQKHGYGFDIEPLDIFQRPSDMSHKQTTWRITLWHPQRTLTTVEANKLMDELAKAAANRLKTTRI
jgi:phenylalanyl-tRNA synthetase beta subunit